MQSLIHLYNTALAQLGGEQIPLNISPIESDTNGAICQNIFPHILDSALEAHAWGFAKRRVVLPPHPDQKPENPAYAFRYGLPADCVRPVRVVAPRREGVVCLHQEAGRSSAYDIEGDSLLCNVEQAELLYVARIADPRLWPACFAEVLVWKLAAGLAAARNNDARQKQICEQMYELALGKACAKDRAMQNPRGFVSPWRAARGNRREQHRGIW